MLTAKSISNLQVFCNNLCVFRYSLFGEKSLQGSKALPLHHPVII